MNHLFTTWEKYQFLYIERRLRKKLTNIEKCAVIIMMKWRE